MTIHIREIAVSATPTEQWTKFKYARCPLWIDETMGQWLARFNGMVLPTLSGEEPTPPTVIALEDAFPSLQPYLAKSENRKKYNLCNDPKFAQELLAILADLVSKEKNCVFLRPDSRKKNCRKLTETIRTMNHHHHVKFDLLTYFGALDKALFGDSRQIPAYGESLNHNSSCTIRNMKDTKLELKYFNWHKETRTLTTDLSSIPVHGDFKGTFSVPNFITIDNPNTKQSRVFRYLKTDKDEEGDIQAWHYENISHGLKLTIWND